MNILAYNLAEKAKQKKPYIIGISGIDGSGKGFISKQLRHHLEYLGFKVYLIGIDGWLQPPSKRFADLSPGEHFYSNGFRFDEFEVQLFRHLSVKGSIDLVAKHSDPGDSEELIDYHYNINDADIIIFEGIFLLQPRFQFDYSIWIDCSFETAFNRALERNQEGISPERMKLDYDNIYFAAQRIHIQKDQPRLHADFIYPNDAQLMPNSP